METQESGGIADWRIDISAARGTDEALWDGQIDSEQELEKFRGP